MLSTFVNRLCLSGLVSCPVANSYDRKVLLVFDVHVSQFLQLFHATPDRRRRPFQRLGCTVSPEYELPWRQLNQLTASTDGKADVFRFVRCTK